jgi:hypothetical protein
MVTEHRVALPEPGARVRVRLGHATVAAVVVCSYDEGSGPRVTVEIPFDSASGTASRTLTVPPERVRGPDGGPDRDPDGCLAGGADPVPPARPPGLTAARTESQDWWE